MVETTFDSTKKRLDEIESELESLSLKRRQLKEKWESEKRLIAEIGSVKSEIAQKRTAAEEYERQGKYEKVAEMRYGSLRELERRLKDSGSRLAEVQKHGRMLKEEVSAEDIAEVVSKWTHIPVSKMLETEKAKLIGMEERIHSRLINQKDAVASVSNAIRRARAGLQDSARPVGSFIFIGSTGVGKTELAKALAEFLFDDESAMVRIDMSEYMEKHSVSRLIGAPPGYVGYDEGGQLTEAVRRKPYSVVLLDEIEKAHPEVFNVLLQALDDGRLTDGKGRTVNFRNTIIIMTSNLGTELFAERLEALTDENRDKIAEEIKPHIIAKLRQTMRPEFLNRIDDIILFKPLTRKEIEKIADLQIKKLCLKLEQQNISLKITDRALAWLSSIGFDVNYGARPLKRAVQKYISDPLALKLLSNEFISGDTVIVDSKPNGEFFFQKSK